MAWYHPDWDNKFEWTTDPTKIPSSQTDFPIFIDLGQLGASHDFWTNVRSDGGDIRVQKNGTTEVAVEVVAIDTTAKTGELHVDSSGTLDSVTADVFEVYYNNPTATLPAVDSTYGAENVWNSAFVMVQHMDGAAYTDIDDSTSNNTDVTVQIGGPTYEQAAQVGDGVDFSGSSEYLQVPDSAAIDFDIGDPFSISCWFNTSAAATRGFISKWNGTDGWHSFIYDVGGKRRLVLQFSDGAAYRFVYGNTSISDGAWHLATLTHDGSNTYAGMKIFIDGVEETYNTGASGTITAIANSQNVSIAHRAGTTPLYFDGLMDEVHLSNAVRSEDWHTTLYNSQNAPDTFGTYSAEMSDTPAVSDPPAATASPLHYFIMVSSCG